MEKTKAEDKAVRLVALGHKKVRQTARYVHRNYTMWIAVVIILLGTGYLMGKWMNTHEITIIIRGLPENEMQNPTVEPYPMPKNAPKTPLNETKDQKSGSSATLRLQNIQERFYATVLNNESSNGRITGLNAYCHSIGKINQVGFDPQHKFCFKDVQEQKDMVYLWVKNRLGKNCYWVKRGLCRETPEELLVLYSSGAYNQFIASK